MATPSLRIDSARLLAAEEVPPINCTAMNLSGIGSCKYSPWLARTGGHLKRDGTLTKDMTGGVKYIGWITAVLYVLYVFATLFLYNKKKKKLYLLSARMHAMVNWSSMASLIIVGWSSLRFIVGVENYSCDLWIWMILLAVPANATPLVLRLVQLNFRYTFANRVRDLTSGAFDEEKLRQLVTMKGRMEFQWSAIVGTGVVVLSLAVSIPTYFVTKEKSNRDFNWNATQMWCNPATSLKSAEEGIGCGTGCGSTMQIFFAMMGFIGIALVCSILALLRVAKEGRDTFGIKRELMIACVSWFVWILVYIVVWAASFIVQWSATSMLAVYIILMGAFFSHNIQCVMPLYLAIKHEKKLKKAAKGKGDAPGGGGPEDEDGNAAPTRYQILSGNVKPPSNLRLLRNMLKEPIGVDAFEAHLMREFAPEGLTFWKNVGQVRRRRGGRRRGDSRTRRKRCGRRRRRVGTAKTVWR
jgi:hypothetical protein